ncbi:MAG: hypothetical protein JWO30_46 [Fibrobacteres bacterium]|nr:hypothetical protein [Fibrobacterota bacterium]
MPDLMMPAATPIRGFGVSGAGIQDAVNAGAPVVQGEATMKQMGEEEETKQKAIAYRKLLHAGAPMMKQYAAEIGKEFPELGNQLSAEADQYGTFLQDPNLDAAQAEEYTHHFYDGANNRYKVLKDAKAPKPAVEKPEKPWAPTNAQEAEDWYRFKKETDSDYKTPTGGRGGSAADRARAEKRMTALRKIPALWKQIEELRISGGEIPLIPGKDEPDMVAFRQQIPRALRTKWDDLRKELNKVEADAGLEASKEIMGPGIEKSASYKLYKAPTAGGETGTRAPSPAAPAKSQNSVDAALEWLKDPKSKTHPRRADILAEVQKAGVDTSGL